MAQLTEFQNKLYLGNNHFLVQLEKQFMEELNMILFQE